MRVICLNGPAQSGKDTVGRIIQDQIGGDTFKFAAPLDAIANATLNLSEGNYDLYREKLKDENLPGSNVTMRQLLIAISEDYIKPLFGEDWFGKQAAKVVRERYKAGDEVMIFTDTGFQVEYDALKKLLDGISDIKVELWRITRPDHTFKNDSREFVETPDKFIYNNECLRELDVSVSLSL